MIHSFRHRGLQRLYERGEASRLHADHVPRLRLILTLLDAATKPSDMNFPGSGFHALRGNLRGFYAVRVSGNWRVIFRFDNAGAYDVDYLDYHQEYDAVAMHNPEHPGRVLKELYVDALGLTVTEVAKGLGVSRQALSNLLNAHSGITPEMALRLEKAFGTSRQAWLNMQQNYDLWLAIQEADLSHVRVFVPSAEE